MNGLGCKSNSASHLQFSLTVFYKREQDVSDMKSDSSCSFIFEFRIKKEFQPFNCAIQVDGKFFLRPIHFVAFLLKYGVTKLNNFFFTNSAKFRRGLDKYLMIC